MLFSGIAASAPTAFARTVLVVAWRSIEKDQRTDNQGDCGHKQSDYKRKPWPTGSSNWTDANGGRGSPSSSPEFLRDLRIAETILVKVKQVQAQPVLDFALAQDRASTVANADTRPNLPPRAQTKEYARRHRNPALAAQH